MSFRFPSRLYAIADPCGRTDLDPGRLGEQLLAGGARILQLRWKETQTDLLLEAARELRRLTRERDALLIVNDRVDVALAADADGVHLGQNDLPASVARRQVGPSRIVGISTHDVAQALSAERDAADYIGFGPLYGTATKETGYKPRGLEALSDVRDAVRLPIVAIGGIRVTNARAAIDAGADAVAMISELCLAPDPTSAVRRALGAIER